MKQATNGAIVTDDEQWYWAGRSWAPLHPEPASSRPGALSKESRAAITLQGSRKMSSSTARLAGESLAAMLERGDPVEYGPQRSAGASKSGPDLTAAYEAAKATCPLPVQPQGGRLAGGLSLLPDEFLVQVGRDWGINTQRLSLTTHRLIHSRGITSRRAQAVYLTDIRDVQWHKHALQHGQLIVDTASGRIEGLPALKNGAAFRDNLLQLVHWARQRQTQPVAALQPIVSTDIPGQIAALKQLADDGALTFEEFEAKKTELLKRM
jgi:hypothetical protein